MYYNGVKRAYKFFSTTNTITLTQIIKSYSFIFFSKIVTLKKSYINKHYYKQGLPMSQSMLDDRPGLLNGKGLPFYIFYIVYIAVAH